MMFRKPDENKVFVRKNEETTLKYALVGDAGSSKTALIQYYTTGVFPQTNDIVIGVEFHMKKYTDKGCRFKIELWNLSEDIRCSSIIKKYITSSEATIIFVEMERKSVKYLQKILDEHFQKNATTNNNPLRAIIGCYSKTELKQLSHDELKKFSQDNGIDASLCFEVDITKKQQIDSTFDAIHKQVISIYNSLLEPVVLNESKASTLCRPFR